MSLRSPQVYDELTPDEADRIDAICDRFERAWQASQRDPNTRIPELASYVDVDGVDESLRVILIVELVEVDRACRQRYGVAHTTEVYAALGYHSQTTHVGAMAASSSAPCEVPMLPGLQILEVLGSGGMGLVYRARQESLHRDVAVKLLLDERAADKDYHDRFLIEAQAIASVHHPNLVQVFELGEVAGPLGSRPYIVLEYAAGGTLASYLNGKPQAPREMAQLTETLALAMEHAHSHGIIHRDIKPSNVLLSIDSIPSPDTSQGNAPRSLLQNAIPKITDFGLAKLRTSSDLTRSGDVLGTPSYMAPEQTRGKSSEVNESADIYGLGAILYEGLTGRPPFRAETTLATVLQVEQEDPIPPRRLQPTVPSDLETICLTCLRKEPSRRYPTAKALADDLRRFQEGQPIHAKPTSAVDRVRKWIRRRPGVAGLIGLVLLTSMAGVVGVLWQWTNVTVALVALKRSHEETNTQLYLNEIAIANNELRKNHIRRADVILDETSPEYRSWEWRYLKKQCNPQRLSLRGSGSPVQSVAFSPDSAWLASASGQWYLSQGGELCVWNARTGQLVRRMVHDDATIYSVDFHPDGQHLATSDRNGNVQLWTIDSDEPLRNFLGHPMTGDCVRFDPKGERVASGCRDGSVRIWDFESGTLLHTLSRHQAPVWGVDFHPTLPQIASCDRNGLAHLTEMETGNVVRSFGGFSDFRAVDFSPDGTWIAFATYSGHIVLWDLTIPNSKPIDHHLNAGPILSLQFTPDGSIAWSSRDGSIRISDLRSGQDRYIMRGHEGWGYNVAISPDGHHLASGGNDGMILISNATVVEAPPIFLADGAEIPGLQFTGTNSQLHALGALAGKAFVWDVSSGTTLFSYDCGENPTAMCLSSDSEQLAWVVDNELTVCDRAAEKIRWTIPLESQHLTGLAFSRDNRWLCWCDGRGFARMADVASGKILRSIQTHSGPLSGVALHPDGDRVATVGIDGTFCIASFSQRQVLHRFRESVRIEDGSEQRKGDSTSAGSTIVRRLAFSPDGRRLAVANSSRPLEIWDVQTGRLAMTLDWDAEGASSACWNAEGDRLAAAFGKRIKIWDASDNKVVDNQEWSPDEIIDWHVREVGYGEIRWDWYSVFYHCSQLIELQPTMADHLRRRAQAIAILAEEGRRSNEQAIADLERVLAIEPESAVDAYRLALLQLSEGNQVAYRETCAQMLANHAHVDDPSRVNLALWANVISKNSGADFERCGLLAQALRERDPNNGMYANALMATLLRMEKYSEALRIGQARFPIRSVNEAADLYGWYLMSMLYSKSGDIEKAQQTVRAAEEIRSTNSPEQPLPGTKLVTFWFQRTLIRLLAAEARSLFENT